MKYIPYIVIAMLIGVILFNRNEVAIEEIHTIDTVYVTKVETTRVEKPIPCKTETLTRKIYIKQTDTVFVLDTEQKRYSKEGLYDIWISGYQPALDSCHIYNKTVYRDVTREIVREVKPKRFNMYVNGGFSSICGHISPSVGISMTIGNKISVSPNIGIYNSEPMLSLHLGYKITK